MNATNTIIKSSTIDFANKWNVGVELKSVKDFHVQVKEEYTFYKSPFGNYGIRWHNSDPNDRTIVMRNCSENAEKNSDRIIFHELCHCIFEVRPDCLLDFISPMMSLDIKMVLSSGVPNNICESFLKLKEYNITVETSINGYCNYYKQELIEQGLITESEEFTFDRSKVNPRKHWFKKVI
jgi:hypothetical protein